MSATATAKKKPVSKTPAKSFTKAPAPALAMLKLTEIVPGAHNPRHVIDEKSEAHKSLVASIKAHGVVVPILVAPPEKGKHKLIAGHRRYIAAKAAKVEEIPALIRVSTDDLVLATIENIEREDLNNVELATVCEELAGRGLTQPKIGDAIGRSERWVRNLMKILDLPEATLSAFAAGDVSIEAAGKVAKIAEASPAAAEVLVEKVTGAKASHDPSWLQSDEGIAQMINEEARSGRAGRRKKGKLSQLLEIGGRSRSGDDYYYVEGYHPNDLPISEKDRKQLSDALSKLPKVQRWGYPESRRLNFNTPEDVDAARAFGCLLELPHNGRGAKVTDYYATDPAWIADRAQQKLEEHEKQAEKAKVKDAAERSKPKAELSNKERVEQERIEQERKRERQKEAKAKQDGHEANVALGHNLYKLLSKPKISADVARLFALIAIEDEPDELAARGLNYVREDLHEVVEKKDGSINKVVPKGKNAARAALLGALEKAKTPEQILGVALQAMIAAHFAHDKVAIQGDRVHWSIPGAHPSYGSKPSDPDRQIPVLLERIASEAGVLPEVMAKDAEKRARGRS